MSGHHFSAKYFRDALQRASANEPNPLRAGAVRYYQGFQCIVVADDATDDLRVPPAVMKALGSPQFCSVTEDPLIIFGAAHAYMRRSTYAQVVEAFQANGAFCVL